MTLAVVLVAGAPLLEVAALGGALVLPLPVAAGLGLSLAGLASRGPHAPAPPGESEFLRAVAAELRSGASLRSALVAATSRVPELRMGSWARLAAAGHAMPDLAQRLTDYLPHSGRAAAAAVELLAQSGGSAAAVFGRLAGQTDDQMALEREVSTATAQARLSAVVVAAAPVVVVLWLAGRGTLLSLLATNAGLAIVVVGFGLQFAGLAAVVVMLRRVTP